MEERTVRNGNEDPRTFCSEALDADSDGYRRPARPLQRRPCWRLAGEDLRQRCRPARNYADIHRPDRLRSILRQEEALAQESETTREPAGICSPGLLLFISKMIKPPFFNKRQRLS